MLNNVDAIYLDFGKTFDKVCTIFYETDNNLLLSMEQHQVKLTIEVTHPNGQC